MRKFFILLASAAMFSFIGHAVSAERPKPAQIDKKTKFKSMVGDDAGAGTVSNDVKSGQADLKKSSSTNNASSSRSSHSGKH